MSWSKSPAPDGGTVWSGTDAVAVPYDERNKVVFGSAVAGGGCLLLLFLLIALNSFIGLVNDIAWEFKNIWLRGWPVNLREFIVRVLLLVLAVAVLVWLAKLGRKHADKIRRIKPPSNRYHRQWTLRGDRNGFTYQAEPFSGGLTASEVGASEWHVGLDEVARAEVGRTEEWQPRRHYPNHPIFADKARGDGVFFSDGKSPLSRVSEHQTFLYLRDGSRRIVFTVEAAREDAATLAHSIAQWLEETRSATAAQPAPVKPQALPGSDREGYDI